MGTRTVSEYLSRIPEVEGMTEPELWSSYLDKLKIPSGTLQERKLAFFTRKGFEGNLKQKLEQWSSAELRT